MNLHTRTLVSVVFCFLSLGSLLLQGCAGVMVFCSDQVEIENPLFGTDRGRISDKEVMEHLIADFKTKGRDKDYGEDLEAYSSYDADELLKYWGKPDEIKETADGEIWVYDFGNYYEGIVVILIIPIPLGWPFCNNRIEFTTEDNQVVKAWGDMRTLEYWVAGLFITGNLAPVAVAESKSYDPEYPKEVPEEYQMTPCYLIKYPPQEEVLSKGSAAIQPPTPIQ